VAYALQRAGALAWQPSHKEYVPEDFDSDYCDKLPLIGAPAPPGERTLSAAWSEELYFCK
jgi:hypothetical protein